LTVVVDWVVNPSKFAGIRCLRRCRRTKIPCIWELNLPLACCPLSRRARYGVMAGLHGSPALLCQRALHREGRVLVEYTAVGPPEPLSGVVVYKVDRLTRSLADFARLVEIFDAQNVSFVSVTQQFNTTSSMGRLTLNVLLSFAQFEREVTGERIREHLLGTASGGQCRQRLAGSKPNRRRPSFG